MSPPIVDLSIPIHDRHCRWKVDFIRSASYERGDVLQATGATMSFHGFTHMDSPRHFDRDGFTTSEITAEMTVGPAAVVRLKDIQPNQRISVPELEAAGADIRPGDIVLLNSNWEHQRSVEDLSFWTDAPWLDADGCRWLREKKIKAIAYDFPQDYCIRDYATKARMPEWEENTSHIELLLNGVIMFEYLCNMGSIKSDRPLFVGLPIRVENSDGAPARVVVFDEEQG